MKTLLGYGQSRKFTAPEGWQLLEEGRKVFAVPDDFWCNQCDGCGCKSCKWSGENKRYKPRPFPTIEKPKDTMQHSQYQLAIFAFIRGESEYISGDLGWDKPLPTTVSFNGKKNCVVEAVAGSGKTTTIVQGLEYCPKVEKEDWTGIKSLVDPKVLFVAFNKHIAEELARRVPRYVQASTLNSTGWSICRANSPGVQMDVKKTENILRTVYSTDDEDDRKIFYAIKNQVSKMVGLLKALMVFSPQDANDQFLQIADKYDVEIPELKGVDFQEVVIGVWQRAINNVKYMDFDDQIFMPVYHDWAFPEYDWVFGDEAQDWSPVQIELVRRLGRYGRIVAVGDRHQSIYGFRGADPDAIPNIICDLDAAVLPLSICYRCPDAVIAQAREIVPHIENPDNNPKGDGIVKTLRTEEFEEFVRDGDYVLCRTTAPLVRRCLRQIRIGKKATVKGKDIGAGLVNLLTSLAKSDRTSVATFLESLAQYRASQIEKLTKAGREQEASNVEDRCDTLEVLAIDCNVTGEIAKRIDQVFSDTATTGIIFMTGHRCKGLEAHRIFFLRPDLCPHPKSKKDWQVIQESNLRYVIITRSMGEFYYVTREKDEK